MNYDLLNKQLLFIIIMNILKSILSIRLNLVCKTHIHQFVLYLNSVPVGCLIIYYLI